MISNGNVDTEQSRMRTFCCVPVSSFAGPAFSFANLLATNPIHERLDCGEQRKTPLDAHIRLEYRSWPNMRRLRSRAARLTSDYEAKCP